ncbi:hypothetical protein [Chlorogloeopsis sp. ULAP02]|uniref:hypothetical protein n=1 Tax=Chlorogloeopsis sp. ULAP02 TaxID=3107926 RepID=UPI0031351F7E
MMQQQQITGKIDPQTLTQSRLQLHYAIQFIAAISSELAQPKPDYSHTSLSWNPELKAFIGELIPAEKSFRVALEPVNLTSLIIDEQNQKIAELSLNQKTLAAGIEWHKQEIAKLGADADKVNMPSYPYADFPDYKIAHGAAFDANTKKSGRQELANYYAITNLLLQEIVAKEEGASSIHIWPHHFDIATLVTVGKTSNGEPITVGIGMSPGDTNYNEPYWYVSPYPYPEITNLTELASGGFWHTQDWVGAVLKASDVSGEGEEKIKQIQVFLDSALQGSKSLFKA